MSGKKRSEVQAALTAAAGAASTAREARSTADARSLKNLARQVDAAFERATSVASLRRETLPEWVAGTPEGSAAVRAQQDAASSLATARQLRDESHSAASEAKAADTRAESAMRDARAKLTAAEAALAGNTNAHGWYMDAEHAQATQAKVAFEGTQRAADEARRWHEQAREAAVSAQIACQTAESVAESAHQLRVGARAAAAARRQREDEARHMAEESKRRAATALAEVHAAADGIPTADARRFAPADQAVLVSRVTATVRAFESGAWDRCSTDAPALARDARALATRVVAARTDFDHRHAVASAARAELESVLAAADPALVRQWAADPRALTAAADAVASVQRAIAAERFEEAVAEARRATATVGEATDSAAEAMACDQRRNSIADAIMESLHEMHYQVSFEAGERDRPVLIKAQTADSTGRGDFDLAVPLDGEIDFELHATSDDISCVAAVEQLQEKLAERGVAWRTTDWGHAEGRQGAPLTPTGTGQVTQTAIVERTVTGHS